MLPGAVHLPPPASHWWPFPAAGSRHYFDLNARPLANAGCTVYTFDLRCHGESGRPSWASAAALPACPPPLLLLRVTARPLCGLWLSSPGTPPWRCWIWSLQGLRIARLAADLRDLLTELDLQDVTVVGTR